MSIYDFVQNLWKNSYDYSTPMTVETAANDLDNFAAEGWDLPDGITPESFADAWNELVTDQAAIQMGVDSMRRIFIDNGTHFTSAAGAIAALPWETIVAYMDDETRETVADEGNADSNVEFLVRYLELAPADLIIG